MDIKSDTPLSKIQFITPDIIQFGYVESGSARRQTPGNMSLDMVVNTLKEAWPNDGKSCACAAHYGVTANIVVMKRETGSEFEQKVSTFESRLNGMDIPDSEYFILIEPRVTLKDAEPYTEGEFVDNLEPDGFNLRFPNWVKVEYMVRFGGRVAKETFQLFQAGCVSRCLALAGHPLV